MKHRFFLTAVLVFSTLLINSIFAEGTKELCPNSTDKARIYLSNPPGYTNFANYNAAPNYRLYIHVQNVNETILWGLQGQTNPSNIQYRLKDPSGNVVFTGTVPTTGNGQPGLISSYAQAVTGPFPASGGYTPVSYQVTSAAALGDYYMEFNSSNYQIELFDFNVVTGANNPAQVTDLIPGRVFSQSWQLYASLGPVEPFNSKFFVYSDDGIVTSLTFSQAQVGACTILCNQFGVNNTGNFTNDRKSVNTNTTTTFPGIAQYKVFLNNPDPLVYPDGVYGSMTTTPQIIPDPAYPECSGKKIIVITVNKAGTVDIFIDLPYGSAANDVHLYQAVVPGVNNIPWDGKDGLGVQVVDGTDLTVTVTYMNGLTNLPLWDIEQNNQGFIVNLVRPISTGINPLVFWDDSNITGSGGSQCPNGSNLAGCSPPGVPPVPGCHPWGSGGSQCHDKMINTWWYSASSSTATLNVYYSGYPVAPTGTNSARCGPGVVNLSATVNSQQTVDWYTAATGGVPVLSGSLTFVTPFLASTTTYYAETRNTTSGCLSLTRTPVIATINAIPPPPTGVTPVWRCGQGSVNLNATSAPVTTYWFDVPTAGSPLSIGDNFTTPFLTATTTYYAESQNTVTQCMSTSRTPIVAEIRPVPQLTNTIFSYTICSASTVTIPLASNPPGATFTWTATLISGSATGFSGGSGNQISQQLFNTGIGNAVVDYSVTPTLNSCTGNPVHFTVMINTLTIPVIGGPASACFGTSKTYTTAAGMSNYLWNVTGGTVTVGGTTADNSITITWNALGNQSLSVNYTDPSGCTASSPTVYNVTVNPLPVPTITGSNGVCAGTAGVVYSTEAGKSGYVWNIPSGGTITSGQNTNSVTVTWNTPGAQTITVTYNDVNSCAPVSPTVYNVTVFTLPVPVISGSSSVCVNSTGNIYNTESGKSGYTWNITGGIITAGINTNAVTITWNTVGAQTLTVNYTDANGCQASSPTVYNVTVHPLPVPTIAGSSVICAGSTGVIYTTQPGMSGYAWTVSPGGTVTNINNETLTVTWNTPGNQSVSVNYINGNGCTAAAPVTYPVTVNPLPVPVIAGPAAICLNTQGTYTTQPGMLSYTWSVGSGGSIVSGSGTNSIAINWTTTGSHTVFVNYIDLNNCTAPASSSYSVTVNPLPVPGLSGVASICTGFSTTYTTDPGMTSYVWNFSAGGTKTAGGNPGDNFITILWTGVGAQSVNVNYTVVATGCTAPLPTTLNVTVNPLPVPTLAGPAVICAGTTGNTYLTEGGMTGYLWTISAGGTITSGGSATDNSVTISWNTPGPQTVKVNYTNSNGCTALTQVTYPVTVNPLPVPTISGPNSICLNATGTYTTEPSKTGYSWTVSAGGTITAGTGTNAIDVLWSSTGPHLITVNYFDGNSCTAPAPTNYTVTVNPLPSPTINGSAVVCQTNTTTYTTEAGMNNYTWTVSAGGVAVAGGGTANSSITINWITAGPQTVSVNYNLPVTGCTAAAPFVFNVLVNPKPAISNTVLNFQQCSGLTTSIDLQSTVNNSSYTWTATGTGPVTGFSNGNTPSIVQTLVNNGSVNGSVTYSVTPTATGCPGDVTNFVVTVFPVSDVIFTPAAQNFCSGNTTSITITGNVAGTVYNWTATGSSGNINGMVAGSGTSGTIIQQTLNNTGTMIETATYSVTPVANGCIGTVNNAVVTVNPLPSVTYTGCEIQLTSTNAKPFQLKGGSPVGGTYSGPGVSGGIFNPALAGAGIHPVVYAYSNTWGCSGSQMYPITVLTPIPFACGGTLTDIRDNKVYPTVQIGAQCWMSTDLNYGSMITSASMQRDNCVAEKYCYGDSPANCASSGGLYQWDELMQYDATNAGQGFCPPGWHVPSESDWTSLFNFYTSNGFAGDPLKYTGFSGFNSYFYGGRFDNRVFDLTGFGIFYWSSTNHGPYKAWGHAINIMDPSVAFYPGNRSHAMFVRCIKD